MTSKQTDEQQVDPQEQNDEQPEGAAPEGPEASAQGGEAGGASAGDSAGDGAGSSDVEAMRDRYLRLAAEFDNFRKRTERERTETWGRAQAQLVERLLDVVDDLQRVSAYEAEKTTATSVLEGVRMVERKLIRFLETAGLETVKADGEAFDPNFHEAITTAPTDERERDDTVADVFQQGYLFKGSLIRPARVRVHKFEG